MLEAIEVSKNNVADICRLSVTQEQREYVAPPAFAIAEAQFYPGAFCYGLYDGAQPVGFFEIYDRQYESKQEHIEREIYIWRFLIDQRYQNMSGKLYAKIGWQLMIEVILSKWPDCKGIHVHCKEGPHSARKFLLKQGLSPTGKWLKDSEELICSL